VYFDLYNSLKKLNNLLKIERQREVEWELAGMETSVKSLLQKDSKNTVTDCQTHPVGRLEINQKRSISIYLPKKEKKKKS
jgi:hypothetical protein